LFSRGWRWTPHSIQKKSGVEEASAAASAARRSNPCAFVGARPPPQAFDAGSGLGPGGRPSSFETIGLAAVY
jgi:hypothetical protein